MKLERSLIALAVSAVFAHSYSVAALAQEIEKVLTPVKTMPDKEVDVHARTELGTLTEATPIAGSVVSQEQVERLQLVNGQSELSMRVPGFSMVRNLRIPDGGKNYTENRIDGMRVSSTSNMSLFDQLNYANIERIEIITGPGSALYGSGAIGGTISAFSKQPPRALEAKISQEVGSWGYTRTQGVVGASTDDGRFGFILNGSIMDYDGWRKSTAPGQESKNASANERDGASFRTLLRPTDSTSLTLGYDWLRNDFRLPGAIPLNATEAAKLKNASINGSRLRSVTYESDWQQIAPGTYGRSIDDYETYSARLKQLIGERGEFSIAFSRRTADGLGYGAGGSGSSSSVICDNVTIKCATYNVGSIASTNVLSKSKEVAQITRPMYRHEFDFAKSTLYLGTELIEITTDSAKYNNTYSAARAQGGDWGVGSLSSAGSVTKENNATPFVHFEFSPLDKLRFHIGERFDKITYGADDRTAANKDIQKTFNAQILKTGVTYDLNRNHLVWGGWSETFNAPNVSTLLDTAAKGTIGNTIGTDLKPEEGVTRQIGLRGVFADWGLRYDLTLYHSSNKGFVVGRDCTAAEKTALNNGAACNINENTGALTAKGFESMYSWAATSWLDLGASYTYAEAYYNKYQTKAADYTGNSYQAMPRQRLNLRIAVKPAQGWMIELEGDHLGKYFVDTANSASYARPDLFNLRASYRDKNWAVWLHALNITDEKYVARASYSTIAGANVLSAGTLGNSGTAMPLTVRAGLSYNF